MIRSKNYFMVKRNYDLGLWGINRVRALVEVPKTGITKLEFRQITGQDYEASEAETSADDNEEAEN